MGVILDVILFLFGCIVVILIYTFFFGIVGRTVYGKNFLKSKLDIQLEEEEELLKEVDEILKKDN
jgi:hypothetical protein